jgi:hypothetical protein
MLPVLIRPRFDEPKYWAEIIDFGAVTATLDRLELPRPVDPSRKETPPLGIGIVLFGPDTVALMVTP